ncbi:hypothetical protein NYQ66_11885 [Aquibacillus koreensis]|nr:hypothetical protein [Aquibacillus koreensis]MCT2536456.1 hypothetical protein [Aquibacillus koreensis]
MKQNKKQEQNKTREQEKTKQKGSAQADGFRYDYDDSSDMNRDQ